MIQSDTGDHGNIRIDDIHRIQPSAQPDFQHHRIQPGTLEQPERRQGTEFEIGQGNLAPGLVNGDKGRAQIGIRYRLAVDADPLVVTHQVGRGVTTTAAAGAAQQVIQRGAGGALAVGTGNGEYQGSRTLDTETGCHLGNPPQAHVDFAWMQPFQPLQPGGQIHRVAHQDRSAAASSA